MRTLGKTVLPFIFSVCMTAMFIFVFPVKIDAAYSSGHFYYEPHEGFVTITGYLGRETEVTIPSSIAGKPVAEIADGAFDNCATVRVIIVPDTVTLVHGGSFTGAHALERIITYTVGVTIRAGDGVSVEYMADRAQNSHSESERDSKRENETGSAEHSSSDSKDASAQTGGGETSDTAAGGSGSDSSGAGTGADKEAKISAGDSAGTKSADKSESKQEETANSEIGDFAYEEDGLPESAQKKETSQSTEKAQRDSVVSSAQKPGEESAATIQAGSGDSSQKDAGAASASSEVNAENAKTEGASAAQDGASEQFQASGEAVSESTSASGPAGKIPVGPIMLLIIAAGICILLYKRKKRK